MCDTRASVDMKKHSCETQLRLERPQSSDSDAEEPARRWRWQEARGDGGDDGEREGKRDEALPEVPWGNLKQNSNETGKTDVFWRIAEIGRIENPSVGVENSFCWLVRIKGKQTRTRLHLLSPPKKEPVVKERKSQYENSSEGKQWQRGRTKQTP